MNVPRLMRRLAQWHIWVGWVAALPILLWVITGLLMAARPLAEVRGEGLQAPPGAVDASAFVLPKFAARVEAVQLVNQPDGPMWIVTEQGGGRYRYSAKDGTIVSPVILDEAERIATAAYAGDARLEKMTFIPADSAPIDLRRNVDAWQGRFSDGTYVYIDGGTGEVLALRTKWWRFYDFLYGLHIMDPAGRESAHNPFLVVLGLGALAGAVLGSILLFRRRKARPKA